MGFGTGSRNTQLSITDPKVCRSYLVGTCPHDQFTNTKQDFGPCPKVHSEALKAEYEAASPAEKAKWGFEYDYLRDMQKYIEECDRRIETAQRRLEKTPDEIRQTNNLVRFFCGQEESCLSRGADNHLSAEANIRSIQDDQCRSSRSVGPRRAWLRVASISRTVQDPHS